MKIFSLRGGGVFEKIFSWGVFDKIFSRGVFDIFSRGVFDKIFSRGGVWTNFLRGFVNIFSLGGVCEKCSLGGGGGGVSEFSYFSLFLFIIYLSDQFLGGGCENCFSRGGPAIIRSGGGQKEFPLGGQKFFRVCPGFLNGIALIQLCIRQSVLIHFVG